MKDNSIYVVAHVWADEGDAENGPPAKARIESYDIDYFYTPKEAIDFAWERGVEYQAAKYRDHPLQGEPDIRREAPLTYYSQVVRHRIPRGITITKYTGQAALEKVQEMLRADDQGDDIPF